MAYTRAIGNIVWDNAHADGLMAVFGIGRDWDTSEPREELGNAFTPDIWSGYGWDYGHLFEYLPKLGGIGPRGDFPRGGTTGADLWSPRNGYWQKREPCSNCPATSWHFYDARANARGAIHTTGAWGPNFIIWLWRMGRNAAETDDNVQPAILIQWGAADQRYALYLPSYRAADNLYHDRIGDRANKRLYQPALYGRIGGGDWTLVDTLDAGNVPRLAKIGEEPVLQIVRVEHVPEAILIRFGDSENPWVYAGEWEDTTGAKVEHVIVGPGVIDVEVAGHTVMMLGTPITYPTSSALKPKGWFVTNSELVNQTPTYKTVTSLGSGSAITVAAEYNGPYTASHPVVTFTGDGSSRAILHCVQEYRPAIIPAGTSAPLRTHSSSDVYLTELSGTLDCTWRGSTCEGVFTRKPGGTLPTIKANQKLIAGVNVNDGDTSASYRDHVPHLTETTVWTDDSVDYQRLFTGYTLGPGRARDTGIEANTTMPVKAAGIVEARLQRSDMYGHCSYEGWNLKEAFEHILNRAGVPSALIWVDPVLNSVTLPTSTLKGKRKLQPRPDSTYTQYLDQLVDVVSVPSVANPGTMRGVIWGEAIDGVVFCKPAYEHTAAAFNYALTDADADEANYIENLHSDRSFEEFCNYLFLMVGEGPDAEGFAKLDRDSWYGSSGETFIGDLWVRCILEAEGSENDTYSTAAGLCQKLWLEANQRHWLVDWTMTDCPWIMPDDEVKLTIGSALIPSGSIYRVLTKRWGITGEGRFTQTLTASMVEVGS